MPLRLILLVLLLASGCNGGPSPLAPPDVDPDDAADEAMSLYDKNADGNLSAEELEACPGLQVAIKMYDQDGDDQISRDEIAAHLKKLSDRQVALCRLVAVVYLDKRPLVGANVRFVPESYLGEDVKSAEGTTGKRGAARMAIKDEELPENQKGIRGVHYGTYRVEITHPEEDIPAKYNSETTLGYETIVGQTSTKFDLSSR